MTNELNYDSYLKGSPYYSGQETFIPLVNCNICEHHVDQDITVTLTWTGDCVCTGCAKMLNVEDYFNGDGTLEMIQETKNELKPIL